MKKYDLKLDIEHPNILLWWNGAKWLYKETCKTEADALVLKNDLENRQKDVEVPIKEQIKQTEKLLVVLKDKDKNG